MGSTVVAAIFLPDQVVVAHAGDTRLYSTDQAGGKLLTEDHTLLSQMQKNHAPVTHDPVLLNNVISRAVGPRLSLDLEINVYDRRPESRYMLCSDGVSRYTEPEKEQIALKHMVPRQCAEHGLTHPYPSFAPEAVRTIIRDYTREAGVRNLDREIGSVCRKLARLAMTPGAGTS